MATADRTMQDVNARALRRTLLLRRIVGCDPEGTSVAERPLLSR